MPYCDDEATDKAADAYFQWGERNGYTRDVPNRYDSERVGDVVYLRNVRGVLARYCVLEDGRVGRMRDLKRA